MKKIDVFIDNSKDTVTYKTIVTIGSFKIELSVNKYLGYAKPHHLDHSLQTPNDIKCSLFEELFYYPVEFYTDKSLNKLPYFMITEPVTGYNNRDKAFKAYSHVSNRAYEIGWNKM